LFFLVIVETPITILVYFRFSLINSRFAPKKTTLRISILCIKTKRSWSI